MSRSQAETAIAGYIDGFYNPVRRHSTLDFTSPRQIRGRSNANGVGRLHFSWMGPVVIATSAVEGEDHLLGTRRSATTETARAVGCAFEMFGSGENC